MEVPPTHPSHSTILVLKHMVLGPFMNHPYSNYVFQMTKIPHCKKPLCVPFPPWSSPLQSPSVPFRPLQSPSVPFSPLHSIGYPPPKLQCCRQGTARELERARPAPEVEIQLYQICKFHKDHPPTHVLVDPARWLEDYFPQKSWLLSARCGMVSGFKISLSQYLVRLLLTLPN